jgi:hypothetical protein
LGTCLALEVESRCGRRGLCRRLRDNRPGPTPIRSIGERDEHLTRVLEVAAPQQRLALAGESIRLIRAESVVDDTHTLRRRRAALGLPAHAAGRAILGPMNLRRRIQKLSSRRR